MVFEHEAEYESQWAAMLSIGSKISKRCTIVNRKSRPWRLDSNQTVSGDPGRFRMLRLIHWASRITYEKNRTLKAVAVIAASFAGLVGTIIFLSQTKIISFEMGILMLVALLGMYFGFGVLIAVYRLVRKLD